MWLANQMQSGSCQIDEQRLIHASVHRPNPYLWPRPRPPPTTARRAPLTGTSSCVVVLSRANSLVVARRSCGASLGRFSHRPPPAPLACNFICPRHRVSFQQVSAPGCPPFMPRQRGHNARHLRCPFLANRACAELLFIIHGVMIVDPEQQQQQPFSLQKQRTFARPSRTLPHCSPHGHSDSRRLVKLGRRTTSSSF